MAKFEIGTCCREPGRHHLNQMIKDKITSNWKKFFFPFRATLVAYEISHARGRSGAAGVRLHHSHSNKGYEPTSVSYIAVYSNE